MPPLIKITLRCVTLSLTTFIILALVRAYAQGGEASGPDEEQFPDFLTRNIRFAHLTSDDGLSNNRVMSILEDSHGFMWFYTFGGGLNRHLIQERALRVNYPLDELRSPGTLEEKKRPLEALAEPEGGLQGGALL